MSATVPSKCLPERGGSPPRHIPVDIWFEIFKLCLPHFSERSRSTQVRLPWTLSQVCCEWRHTVQSLPLLWSNITIDFTRYHVKYANSARILLFTETLKRQLQYSMGCPLNIIVDHGGCARQLSSPLWLTLVPHLPQSRILFVCDSPQNYLYLTARSSHPQTTAFPFLHLLCWDRSGHTSDLPAFDLFHNAPRLHHLNLFGEYGEVNTLLPWHQLMVVQLSATNVVGILPQLKRAEFLAISSPLERISEIQGPKYAALPRLRSLTISTKELFEMAYTQYYLPNLQALVVSGHMVCTPQDMEHLTNFLRNIDARNLTTFFFEDDMHIAAPILEGFLESLPTITSLKIPFWQTRTADIVVDILSRTSPDSPLCPSLRSILFDNPVSRGLRPLPPLDAASYLRMIRRRGLEKVEFGETEMFEQLDTEKRWYLVDSDDHDTEGFEIRFFAVLNSSTRRALRSRKRCSFATFSNAARGGQLSALRISPPR